MNMLPFSNMRTTIVFVGFIIAGSGLFASFSDSLISTGTGDNPASMEEPERIAAGQTAPMIIYPDSSADNVDGWYDDEQVDDNFVADNSSDSDFATGAAISEEPTVNYSGQESNAGTIINAPRID